MSDNSNLPPLPRPTVKYMVNPNDINEATARGIMCNPIYAGVPPYQRVVSDEAWVRAAVELIREQGAEQFLVNMLYMLRSSMVEAVSDDAVPDDYDGPWPGMDDDPMVADDWPDEGPSPWQHPIEGYIFCSHDDLPMIIIDDEFVCVAEFLSDHIDGSPITDLVTEPNLALVFQNGHTLPLLCPDCGGSLHIDDQNLLLDQINGLTVIEMEWDEDGEALLLYFGRPDDDVDEDNIDDLPFLDVHLNSVRQLTCPHRGIWPEEEL